MSNLERRNRAPVHFNRIEKVLEYIHQHLSLPLSLDDIAEKSCWSRWQLQRVFTAATGVNVAQYIRELKLSAAAEALLKDKENRILDIALNLGFNSEVSFSRAFKQFFQISPREYRKRGVRSGLRQPISSLAKTETLAEYSFEQVRIEHKDALNLMGCRGDIHGLFAEIPDFKIRVPQIWQDFELIISPQLIANHYPLHRIGVVDATSAEQGRLKYWAAVEAMSDRVIDGVDTLTIPKQEYAVISHRGSLDQLSAKLQWFLNEWLPQSQYTGIDGYELELYEQGYQLNDPQAYMEYWLPISPR